MRSLVGMQRRVRKPTNIIDQRQVLANPNIVTTIAIVANCTTRKAQLWVETQMVVVGQARRPIRFGFGSCNTLLQIYLGDLRPRYKSIALSNN